MKPTVGRPTMLVTAVPNQDLVHSCGFGGLAWTTFGISCCRALLPVDSKSVRIVPEWLLDRYKHILSDIESNSSIWWIGGVISEFGLPKSRPHQPAEARRWEPKMSFQTRKFYEN